MSFIIALVLSLVFFGTSMVSPGVKAFSHSDFNQLVQAGVRPQALRVALKAYYWAQSHGKIHSHFMTLVNFSQKSTQKRLWIINMVTGKVVFNGLVAQGRNTGLLYAKHFSNAPGSKMSSLGAYVTGDTYFGHHGYSLRVHGLEPGINSNAFSRAIVFHSAWYATPRFAEAHDYLGRSWGCFAVNPKYSHYIFSKIKGGSFVFAYAESENHDSHFTA